MDNHPVNLFSGTIDTLSRSLDLRARKHELILNNVANADTPNYKPFALNVEEALQKDSTAAPYSPMKRTDELHLPGRKEADASPDAVLSGADDPLLFRGDHNGVDIDAEMTALAKNSLLYKASAQLVASKLRGLKSVITGGPK
ncbi:flagellar basal body rod protein FlgB [Desulfosarcina alkanivorans]|uniref:Flagellar basal body rod protein FlgB n=1 Tax=Desulfosarcina alkanivorans TaxID=571177 RepID=A0A5K7YE86_9BACT|nr:flagellar basal body rod protein FlgB [Desulfosarcina alkanivorans]BBO66755.1 flagellar basal body rod protein FlgB [Desulfosarcina alkanivorans]